MTKIGEMVVSVRIDTTELQSQVETLQDLLKSLESIPENLISPLLSNLPAVLDDIVLTDSPSATGTRFEILHRARLGAKYERFTAAIRAGEFDLKTL
jgi:hypothetical protein